jgi:hypothetical protein
MATTTPNYGWDVPTSTDYVKDGATAIETLGDDIDATLWTALGGAYPGLRLVKKQAIGTGVTTVAVSNAFSATYDFYKIVITDTVGSTNNEVIFQLTGATTNYASCVIFGSYSGGSATVAAYPTTSWGAAGYFSTGGGSMNVEIGDPFKAKNTSYRSLSSVMNSAGSTISANGIHTLSTSYSGFTLTTTAGTITGGNIYVYGYGIS